MPIPAFRADGYLPEGLHLATEEDVAARFGQGTVVRQVLMERLAEWLTLARAVGARRFLVNGSFVTTRPEPRDVDAVCWLPSNFGIQCYTGIAEAVRLDQILTGRVPEELFAAIDQADWDHWCRFFGQTVDGQSKGAVEVIL